MSTEITAPVVATEENYPPKFTAADVGRDGPGLLRDLGRQIAAHLERARKAEEKAEQHYIAALQLLDQAKEELDAGGFVAFKEKYCPNIGQSRAYELRAIATGKKSLEDTRAATRERVTRHRAKKTDSVTTDECNGIAPTSTDTTDTENPADDKVILWDTKTGVAYVDGNDADDRDVDHVGDRDVGYAGHVGGDRDVHAGADRDVDNSATVAAAPAKSEESEDERLIREGEAAAAEYTRLVKETFYSALADYYGLAAPADIYNRIPDDRRKDVLAAFPVEHVIEVFGEQLRTKLPANPILKLRDMDNVTAASTLYDAFGAGRFEAIAAKVRDLITPKGKRNKSDKPFKTTMQMEPAGTDASGNPNYAPEQRGNSSRH